MRSPQRQGLSSADNAKDFLPAGSFREVLDSIQGLHRVVQEVTLDEIVGAEQKAFLMIQRLSSLQTAFANFAAIRQLVTKVREASLREAENSGAPANEIPQEYLQAPNRAFDKTISVRSDARFIKQEIDLPARANAPGTVPLVTNNHPAAQHPTGAADGNLITGGKENPPVTEHHDFTLGENELREKKFELGVVLPRVEGEEKKSDLDEDHYAAIACAPMEDSPATFFFDENQESSESPATPKADLESVPPGFFDRMIDDFTKFVGPMAAVIVDEQVAALGESLTVFPRLRLDELVALISREILDRQSKVLFQKQTAEKIRTLTSSQASLVPPRKKND